MPLQSATSLRATVVIISQVDPTAPDGFEEKLLSDLNVPADDPFGSSVAAARANQIALPVDRVVPSSLPLRTVPCR